MDTSELGLERESLTEHLAETLDINRFRDYCPNGLQVEGKSHIRRLVTGVTASLALLDAAIEINADAVLVHHGYFWRGEDPRVVGNRRLRLKRLLDHELNLYAYHLPLDAHRHSATMRNWASVSASRLRVASANKIWVGMATAPPKPSLNWWRWCSVCWGGSRN